MSTVRLLRRSLVAGAALAVVPATAALAHPFVEPDPLPVDTDTTMTLAMAHGCEEEGPEQPTSDVALEVPDWLRVIEVPEPDGFEVELEPTERDEQRVGVVRWSAQDPDEAAPELDLAVVAGGEPDQERFLRVTQSCDDFTYQWVGTPEDEADDPAVAVTLGEPAADAEAPADDEPTPAEQRLADATGDGDDDAADDAGDGNDGAEDAGEPADDPARNEAADDADEAGADEDPQAAGAEDGGSDLGWLIVVVVVVLGLGGVLHARSRSSSDAT